MPWRFERSCLRTAARLSLPLALERVSPAVWCALAAGAVCSTPLGSWLWQKLSGRTWAAALSYLAAAGLFVLCLLAMAGGGFRPFIYFQF